ncbi:MAG: hypothetical protein KDA98_07115 [Acidimicrobiales bacterium]|nr:hypothetical protein [Acidimicrobiales bacterium]
MLEGITRRGVNLAMAEFDELGRDAFLERYGYGPARNYFLVEGDHRYDSKALVAAAWSHEHPGKPAPTPAEFSGGLGTVARRLQELGFQMEYR